MKLKRIVLYTVIVYLIVVVFSNGSYRLEGNELTITRWNYELEEIEPNKTKISYSVFLTNVSEGNIFIRTLLPEYKNEILNDIEHDDTITVSKEIVPKESIEVSWDILINKQGLEVKEIKEFLESIKVNAKVKGENVIGHDLTVTFYQ